MLMQKNSKHKNLFFIFITVIVMAITFCRTGVVKAYYQKNVDITTDISTVGYSDLTFSLDKSIYASCDNEATVQFTVSNPNNYAVSYSLSFSNSIPTYAIDGMPGTTYIVGANTSKTNTIVIDGSTGTSITITVDVILPYSTVYTHVVNFDNTCPVVSLSPNTSGTYVKSASVIATVSDNQIKSNQSIKYRWQETNSCSTTVEDYTSVALPSTNAVTINASDLTGTYYLCVYSGIQDVAGNSSAAVTSGVFYFDNIAPTITAPEGPFYVRKDSTPLIDYATASDSGGSGLNTFTANYTDTSNLSLGEHSLTYTATDNAGNTTTETLQMIVYTKIDCDMDDITTDPTDADRCIFRGANPDNWILFDAEYNGNDPVSGTGTLYRIIGKEANDTAKIIVSTDQRTIGITLKDWAFNSTASSTYDGSSLRTYLNSTYYNVLKDTTKNMIQPTRFDVGTMNYYNTSSNTIANTVTAEKSSQEPSASYVATWNVYDFLLASTNCSASTPWTTITTKTNGIFPCDVDNWMVYDTTSSYEIWFITPHTTGRTRRYMSPANASNSGSIQYADPTTTRRIRPVTYLKSTVIIIGGTGTESDPYILAPDKFIGTPYTVTFNPTGGTVSPTTKVVRAGNTYGDLPTPTREGYTFAGWSYYNGYQPVEYVESSGTQYIQTDVTPNNTRGIYIKVSSGNVSATSVYVGSATSSSARYWLWNNNSGQQYYAWNSNVSLGANTAVLNQVYELELNYLNSRKVRRNNAEAASISTTLTTINQPMTIFAGNNNGTINNYSSIKLYDLKFSSDTSVSHHFVPCYQMSTYEIGLYDEINGVFYQNVGTGEFGKGNDVLLTSSTIVTKNEDHTLYALWKENYTVTFNPSGGSVSPTSKSINYKEAYGSLPTPTKSGYTFLGWATTPQVDLTYIESTGIQYINTGFTANKNTGVVTRFQLTDTTLQQRPFGADNGDGVDVSYSWYINGNGYWAYAFNDGTGNWKSTGITANTNAHTIQFNRSSKVIIDNTTYDQSIVGSVNSASAYPLYIFATNRLGETMHNTKMKLYYFRIYDGNTNTPSRNFVPSYRGSDGVVGLFDKANNQFYTNSGTGFFKKGDFANDFITASSIVNINGSHTLYAIWIKSPTVTFDPSGGSVSTTSKTVNYGETYGTLPTPTKSGYNFLGWAYEETTLPVGYKRLTYVQSTGIQYIYTSVVPDNNTGIYIRESAVDLSGTRVYAGSGSSEANKFWLYSNGAEMMYGWNNNVSLGSNTVVANQIYELELNYLNSRKMRVDGTDYGNLSTTLASTNTYPILIFAGNNAGTGAWRSEIKLYNFKISSGTTITHNFIPAVRNSDGAIGLYDTLNNVFKAPTRRLKKGGNVSAYVVSSTSVTKANNHTLYAVWEPVSTAPTCTITTPSGYNTSKTLTINATTHGSPLVTNPYSWNNSSWDSSNTKTVSSSGTYTAYVLDEYGEIGSCSITIKSRQEYRTRTCNKVYSGWTSSGTGYMTNCQGYEYDLTRRRCLNTYTLIYTCPPYPSINITASGLSSSAWSSECHSRQTECYGASEGTTYGDCGSYYQDYVNETRTCSTGSSCGDWGSWSTTNPSAACGLEKANRTTYGT